MALFKNLAIGEKFKFQNVIWLKVTPVKKSCCKILFNAHADGNKDIKKTFDMNQEVEVCSG